ncbi:MAG: 23S rRNA (uracil(1939)-C(5))-methyltransferase RlmD [Clostridia bacterium]|nr:23S rRNA (uracil(1939)-C(5))-methyltransferase RlmD [Clostridia bacterium]
MPEKNRTYEVKIDTMNNLGYGVCRIDGMVCFVKGGVTGDSLEIKVIKANKNYCIGRVERILVPSPYRQEVDCPVFKQCGGCVFRHVTYEHEKELKRSFVEAEFKKAGLNITVKPTVSADKTTRYRNKAQYPVSENSEIGFYAERTHKVCETDDCPLQPEVFGRITSCVKSFMKKYNISGYNEETGRGYIRHIYIRYGKVTGEIQVCIVINDDKLPKSDRLCEELKNIPGVSSICLNVNKKNTNVILGEKYIPLFGNEYIEDELCSFRFRISPASFYQINHDCTELLYNEVYRLVTQGKCDRVTDLYCGTGTIGLSVAGRLSRCKLTGVEIVPEAIENAKLNAKLNGITNAEFICADSTDTQDNILNDSDVVILDPPRKGITQELADKISQSSVDRIVYVSCSPDTLARDVKYFTELGYICTEATPFDMFPRTSHVETVVLLSREKADDYIRISVHTKDLKTGE